MPRRARQKSVTHIYHVMMRGNERKDIFFEEADKQRFFDTLLEVKAENPFSLYAFCVMSNHVHLIIKEESENLSSILKRISTRYAIYYNKKHKRVGHLFQDRFKSEKIENEAYLLAAIRYVHDNPSKAGLCETQRYKWSSFPIYARCLITSPLFKDIEDILGMFSNDIKIALVKFLDYSSKSGEESFIDISRPEEVISEAQTVELIESFCYEHNISMEEIKRKEYENVRKKLIHTLSQYPMMSSRRIAGYTGINRETVRRLMLSSGCSCQGDGSCDNLRLSQEPSP